MLPFAIVAQAIDQHRNMMKLDSKSQSRDTGMKEIDLRNFDQYVLLSPSKDENHYGYSTKSNNRNNTIDSKFRSDEKSSHK